MIEKNTAYKQMTAKKALLSRAFVDLINHLQLYRGIHLQTWYR